MILLLACAVAGDLLTALLLGWTARHPQDLATAVEQAVAGLQGVLRATAAAAGPEAVASKAQTAEVGGEGVLVLTVDLARLHGCIYAHTICGVQLRK